MKKNVFLLNIIRTDVEAYITAAGVRAKHTIFNYVYIYNIYTHNVGQVPNFILNNMLFVAISSIFFISKYMPLIGG